MRHPLTNRKVQLSCLVLFFAATYIVWDFEIQKNFHTVLGGKLYRSGQPEREQLERWIKKYNLKTIIVLRHTLEPYEKEIAEHYGVRLHHIILSSHGDPSGDQWEKILGLMTDEKNLPLLYHCRNGTDRTGLVTARYRLQVEHWPLCRALLEMDFHYHIPFSRPDLQNYLRNWYTTHTIEGVFDPKS